MTQPNWWEILGNKTVALLKNLKVKAIQTTGKAVLEYPFPKRAGLKREGRLSTHSQRHFTAHTHKNEV